MSSSFRILNVLDFGATGNGTTDDTMAIQRAFNALPGFATLYFPSGTYLCGPLTISGTVNFKITGAGREASVLALKTTGAAALLTISGANFSSVEDLGFRLNGTPQGIAGTQGVVVDGTTVATGNVIFRNCDFVGFANEGLFLKGSSGFQMSGNEVHGCNFLGNGGGGPTATPQLHSLYSHDFKIESTQYGILAGIAHASIGCLLDNSSAGNYGPSNFHWTNGIGFKAVNCSRNTINANRFEINDQQGVYIDTDTDSVFTANKIYSNSQAGNGSSDNVYVTNATGLVFASNSINTWDASYSAWGVSFNGTCTELTIKGNRIDGWDSTKGPILLSSTTAANYVSADEMFRFSTIGNVNAGVTVHLGINAQQTNSWDTPWQAGKRLCALFLDCLSTNQPGTGNTFQYTLCLGGSPSSPLMRATTTVGLFESQASVVTPQILVPANQYLTVQLVTSASANACAHRGCVVLAEY